MRFTFYLIIFFGIFIDSSLARPVSYPGGWTVMLKNDGNLNRIHTHLSPTHKLSLGYNLEYWHDEEFTLNSFQINNLVKRWNKKNSQANFYIKSGIGLAYSDKSKFDGELKLSGFSGVSFDWENRSYFLKYQNRYTEVGEIYNAFSQSITFGLAPYIGDFGDLHTWLMINIKHQPEKKNNYEITPFIRFFKSVYLFELGLNDKGKFLYNYIIRF
jgi:hypothetical protein